MLVKNKNGKVVVFTDNLLRFPLKTFIDNFNPSKTVRLVPGSQKQRNTKRSTIGQSNKQKIGSSVKNKALAKNKMVNSNVNVSFKNVIPVKGNKAKQKKVETNNKLNYKLPIYFLNNYAPNVEKTVTEIQKQARAMFQIYKGHHLYQKKEFQRWFLNKIAVVINYIEMYNNFLHDVSTSCIIVSTTNRHTSRILALVAAEKGIPTICMQHGIISNELGYLPKIATVDAVYGKFEVDWYQKKGAQPETLEIIGHPRFDQAFSRSRVSRANFNKYFDLDPRKKTLLIAIRGMKELDSWKVLIDTISKKLDLNILIKDFPNFTGKSHVLSKEFPLVRFVRKYNLYDIFPHVDAVVAYTSTVGLEAMLAEKSVFILNKKFDSYTGYYNRLDQMAQSDPRKLAKLVIKYFTDPNWKSYTTNIREKFLSYAYPDRTMSGERLKKLINKLIN
ncbi:hypothetical protein [Aquibacillus albus]|uniref:Lipid-A-disaccharide synthase n=1 Tax=Aquibacillus albus TaxID=1168171 RepID=A0ABS2N1Z0_9BACI|nr:hypothetical protein [Aquibacillus albus]MBM7572150.1 hypothetical protein [Aquibacillus albus]